LIEFNRPLSEIDYRRWISSSAVSQRELVAMRRQVAGLRYLPRISLVLVISDADEVWIKSSVDSVLGQVYPHLEICLCDNGSERPHVAEVLEGYAAADERIVLGRLSEKKSRAEAYSEAASMATGAFVALLDPGDELAPAAIFKVVELLQRVRADAVYTDEDEIDVGGRRSNPVFKPYWSPDLLLSTAYTGRLCVMRRSVLEALGAFREDFEGVEEYDMMLRLSEKTRHIHHLPEVLYHRRKLPGSGVPEDRALSRAIEDALVRRETDATVERGLTEGSFRVVRSLERRPEVSVIVFAPEGVVEASLLDELERRTSYPTHQVIVAGTGRGEHPSVDRIDHPFPARALNLAAGEAEGEYLVFMDARTRMMTPGWLREMLSQAQREDVGTVGCKLLNPNGSLRHGGSLVQMSRLTGHPEHVSEGGHYLPLVDHAFNFAAASSECMVVRRGVFEMIGGFDDANLPTAFYDLDLSFRLREAGLLNVYTPYAQAVCEGLKAAPSVGERRYMWTRWWGEVVRALYYQQSPLHPDHHALDREALSVLPS
jgi:cellulose synthase/poly-beta-1,6-N-acetylglucosamine synthase-like glycosyltransferase